MQKLAANKGWEVWAQYDRTAGVWELFSEETAEAYLGCADTLSEARKLAKDIIADNVANAR
jgi:hypothetical protein